MRILYLIPFLTRGGAERVVVDLANAMSNASHEVTVLLGYERSDNSLVQQLSPAVSVAYMFPHKHAKALTYINIPFWILRNWAYLASQDVLHVHLTFGSFVASIAWLYRTLMRPRRFPAIIETNHSVGTYIKPWQSLFFRINSRLRDGYVLMAEDAAWTERLGHSGKPHLAFIPNGVDLSYTPSREATEHFLSRSGIPEGVTIIGSIGRMVNERNPDALVAVIAEVVANLQPGERFLPHFYFGGDGPELQRISQLIRDSGLEKFVSLPGMVDNPKLAMSCCTLYVTMNVGDTTGISGLEAASLAVPVVSVQMRPDYVQQETDWIWSSPSPKTVAVKVLDLLRHPDSLKSLGDHQQRHCMAYFSATRMAKDYISLYQKCIGEQ